MTESQDRADLAAAFHLAVRMNWHEGVANHFSLATNDAGTRFLINPNAVHFSHVTASNLLELDANDPTTLDQPNAPDPTAWGLHGALHRHVPWARCALHLHPKYSTVLASLADSSLPPIDQNCAMFYDRVVIDDGYTGLAFEEEGERICKQFTDPRKTVMVMGNHGVMVVGPSVAEAWNTLYYFERAAETYITALSTGRPLRVLSHNIALKTAEEMNAQTNLTAAHLAEMRRILDAEGAAYLQ
ncbi:class II aldolase/adducin family protein [Oceanibium sediminis]|uniref:class II aldolase/adducin family protein n=1 Tax=Oceanibium sediminis TaxID=2026339 RepID=UPI000DD4C82A|nr:class II aldolase/adducin family protein [Oceanibium sediminis]